MNIKFSLLAFAVMVSLVSSWGPITHIYLYDRLATEGNSSVVDMCVNSYAPQINKDAFKLGLEMPDITVVYYFQGNGQNYRSTHNFNFQEEVMSQATTDDERCFAWGIAAHLVQDSVSHTAVVPAKINQFHLPNSIIHIVTEQTYDSVLANQNPKLIAESSHMMDAMDGPKGTKYMSMVTYALGQNNINLDVPILSQELATALGSDTFYGSKYTMGGWMFSLYPAIAGILNVITPYLGVTSVGQAKYYMDQSVQLSDQTFTNWGARFQLSPTGWTELATADAQIGIAPYLLLAVILSPLYLFWKKKKKKYLLLIPLFAIIIFFILSMMVSS